MSQLVNFWQATISAWDFVEPFIFLVGRSFQRYGLKGVDITTIQVANSYPISMKGETIGISRQNHKTLPY